MNVALTHTGPNWAVILRRSGEKLMDIILHLGAHRTATTSFQHYLRKYSSEISETGTGIWGPLRTRRGLFSGVIPGPRVAFQKNDAHRAKGRVALQLAKARDSGVARLLISDENMIGTSRHSMRTGALFPSIGERLARYGEVFGDGITRVVLSVRSPEMWWASAAAYSVSRGHPLPTQSKLDKIAASPRSWRDVITDLACAMPAVEIKIATFEEYAARPDAFLAQAAGIAAPKNTHPAWLNRSPDLPALRAILAERGQDAGLLPDGIGRWNPFSEAQAAELRENYADDLLWLAAGADGLATLTEDPTRKRAGISQPAGYIRKGQDDDSRHRKLAQSG